MVKIKKKFSSRKKTAIVAALLVVGGYLVLAFVFKLWPLQRHVTITASSVGNSLPPNNSTTNKTDSSTSSNDASQTTNDNPKAPTPTDTKTLTAPSGTFANLYSADANTQMNSICNTTSGASCQVIFTKGGLSIALPAKTTDSSGVASWAWTPQQIGLTAGKWHVTAKARLGSQTKTTDNGSLELVIQ
jgi:hypothetical protein